MLLLNGKIMQISQAAGYGLIAVCYIAQHCQEGRVEAPLISKQYNISRDYLCKLLPKLVNARILNSKNGPNGGFTMARSAKEITLLEIIEAVDGPMLNHLKLAEQTNNEPFSLKIEIVLQSVIEKARKLYSETALSELI